MFQYKSGNELDDRSLGQCGGDDVLAVEKNKSKEKNKYGRAVNPHCCLSTLSDSE
jgi:hypothetical protein